MGFTWSAQMRILRARIVRLFAIDRDLSRIIMSDKAVFVLRTYQPSSLFDFGPWTLLGKDDGVLDIRASPVAKTGLERTHRP